MRKQFRDETTFSEGDDFVEFFSESERTPPLSPPSLVFVPPSVSQKTGSFWELLEHSKQG